MRMNKCSRKDYITDLPESIIDIILTKLPIRDAVRTSILSTKWRYQWATMTRLVFKNHVPFMSDKKLAEQEITNFIMRFLFLHQGPIYRFKLSTNCSIKSTDMDQWLLFLSRKDIKELVLMLDANCLKIPSCIISCQKLTTLKLQALDVKPPLRFRGFPCLKYLNLCSGSFTIEDIENLTSGCPLLEKFTFTNVGDLMGFAIHAPNLKRLILNGDFSNLNLEHSPFLDVLRVDFRAEAWESNVLMKVPVTYDRLKFIDLQGINYEERNAVLYVLHLILHSPNLQELEIGATPFESSHDKAVDLDFWGKECPPDFTFKHLKFVEMFGLPNKSWVEFLKFVLGRSPVLEVMRVSPHVDYNEKMNMANEVLHFRRASPKVDIRFFD
ncbi:F-box/FBD/LRR-repeat protein At1g13570 [Daucus carota subsp. sativus]|uniref:F-box/FBD/LRR-repeat protein At1g13570 n=1 Tax=Daucus carota subsp. sativus TaxID=79200 RepID=UPI0007F001B8|nr:PREDICTED: F-box/FBD/LRR-repeat protein At1g13570-like isoform X4 [Daucus carota subsp. sativus]